MSFPDLSAIDWGTIGGKLERLVLARFSCTEDDIKAMREHCINLKHIDLRPVKWWENNGIVADFIASDGDQLESVCVYGMEEIELNKVAEACKNARFPAEVYKQQLPVPPLRILGPRLEKILVRRGAFNTGTAEEAAAWNLCINLRVLEATGFKPQGMRAIMATPKHQLIEIILLSSYRNTETIMNIIAEGTKSVETLDVASSNISSSACDKFIDKNNYTLRSINIFKCVTSYSESDVGKMIECPRLQDI